MLSEGVDNEQHYSHIGWLCPAHRVSISARVGSGLNADDSQSAKDIHPYFKAQI